MFNRVVVVGMGYVGTVLSAKLATSGFKVVGVDKLKSKVELLNRGKLPMIGKEPGLARQLRIIVRKGRFKATQDFSECKNADAILVCVETPFNLEKMMPDYSSLRLAIEKISKNLSKNTLVVIESTVAPTTTENIVRPILEKNSNLKAGEDFYLAHCPERVMPGKLLHNIETLDRVVGGINEKSARLASQLYKHIVRGKIYLTDCLTAEVVKTAENSYRDVNIAFANELAIICEHLGVDVYKVRELVNTCPYRTLHLPGSGVGGSCMPKDPLLLASSVKGKFDPKIIVTAREVNEAMPHHMSELVVAAFVDAGKKLKGSTITVLGIAYLENSADTRNSPAIPIIKDLRKKGAAVRTHDPYVEKFADAILIKDLNKALKGSDCLVLVTAHREYKNLSLKRLKSLMSTWIIVDGRNVFDKKQCELEGFLYRGIGK